MRPTLVLASVSLFASLLACSSSSDPKRPFDSCNQDSDCRSPLVCPKDGLMKGVCTAGCDPIVGGQCPSQVGPESTCVTGEVCAPYCDKSGGCPGALRCYTDENLCLAVMP